jgi:DNA-binding transcriptional LysR family regulator
LFALDERDWLIFSVLSEKRNITKTGQALFISQPALTTRLQQIEEELGAKLLYRSTKGIHLTPQGEYLARCSKEMLLRINEIKDRIASMQEDVRGTLRVAASHYMTKYKLPQVLKGFKERYPLVEFKVATTWSREVMNLVRNQEAHVGFVRGDYPWPEERRLLFEETMCVASVQPVIISELPTMPRISYRSDESVQSMIDNWWRENFSVPPLISMEVDRVDTCKDMVLHGLGYAILPSLILDRVDNVNTLIIKDRQGQPIIRKTSLIYQKELTDINLVRAFVEYTCEVDFLVI